MNILKTTIGLLALVPALGFAGEMMDRPPRGEFFDTVLESVDETTAAELQAAREELKAAHDAVRELRGAEGTDEVALQEAIADLRAQREAFRDEIHTLVDENEDLQLALEEAREAGGDRPRGPGRRGPRPPAGDMP